jgi:hypothetical protein
MYICNYRSSRTRNLVAQKVVSCLKKGAKTCLHASVISKIFPGLYPRTHVETGVVDEVGGGGGRGNGKDGKGEGGRKSCMPNDFLFRCAAPDYMHIFCPVQIFSHVAEFL